MIVSKFSIRLSLGIGLFLSLCSHGQESNIATVPSPRSTHVIIISMDGAKPSVVQNSKMPMLKRLIKEGTITWTARTIFPSLTLPSHASMLTGQGPEIHKTLVNDIDDKTAPLAIPTVFAIAKRANLSTALFATKHKFKYFNISGTLDKFFYEETDATRVAQEASEYILSAKPRLSFIHLPDADRSGHQYGWESNEQKIALEKVDSAIAKIFAAVERAGILKKTTFIISADHGGTGFSHGSDTQADMEIPWVAWGSGVKPGRVSAPVVTMDTAATALWLLGVSVPTDWQGKAVRSAFR